MQMIVVETTPPGRSGGAEAWTKPKPGTLATLTPLSRLFTLPASAIDHLIIDLDKA
jgi:hypothetical protein